MKHEIPFQVGQLVLRGKGLELGRNAYDDSPLGVFEISCQEPRPAPCPETSNYPPAEPEALRLLAPQKGPDRSR